MLHSSNGMLLWIALLIDNIKGPIRQQG